MKKSTERFAAKNVEEYLAAQSPEVRAALERLRRIIKSMVPGSEEVISYQIPTVRYLGALVGYAAFQHHCSLYLMSPPLMASLKGALQGFDVSGATVHFTTEKPLPEDLVRILVAARIRENEEREAQRKQKKQKT